VSQAPQAVTQGVAQMQGLAQAQNAVPAQRVAGDVFAARRAREQQTVWCYRIVPDSARSGSGIVMRVARTAGDTLHLVPVDTTVAQRAWVVLRNGATGIMTGTAAQTAARVVASPMICPAP